VGVAGGHPHCGLCRDGAPLAPPAALVPCLTPA
jgi:hypothetical protein